MRNPSIPLPRRSPLLMKSCNPNLASFKEYPFSEEAQCTAGLDEKTWFVGFSADLQEKFFKAVDKGDIEDIKFTLSNGDNVDQIDSYSGFAALHMATKHRDLMEVRLLLQHKAKPSVSCIDNSLSIIADGSTPLHFAVLHFAVAHFASKAKPTSQQSFVDALLSQGADVNTRDIRGDTPLLTLMSYLIMIRNSATYDRLFETLKS